MIWDLHCHLAGFDGGTPEAKMAEMMRYADRMGIDPTCVYMGYPFVYDPTPDILRIQGNYNVTVRSSEHLTIDGITARGGWDGINMHDTRGVTIANCHLYTGDDSLAGANWENVTVTNCILNSSANAIRAGGRNVIMNGLVIFGPGEYPAGTSQRHKLEAGFQILSNRGYPANSQQKTWSSPVPSITW
jgi:hypothetical protein